MKRILCLLLAVLMLFSIVSCGKDGKTDDTEDSVTGNSTSSGGGDDYGDMEEAIAIVKNGASDYVLLYSSNNMTPEMVSMGLKVTMAIKSLTGISIPTSVDSGAEDYDDEKYNYILLGETCFEKSQEAYDELPNNEDAYYIGNSGEDIIIIGRYDDALGDAVEHFIDTMEDNYEILSNTLYFEGCVYDGVKRISTMFSLANLSNYRIIYSADLDGMDDVATALQTKLKNEMGVTLEVYKDSETGVKPYEILVGCTNRKLSRDTYSSSSRVMSYSCIVEKGNLQLAVGGPFSGEKCVNAFWAGIATSGKGALVEGEHFKTDLATKAIAVTEGTDVRIMSANLLAAEVTTEFLPVTQRVEIFGGVLLRYTPDLIGIQEADYDWIDNITPMLEFIARTEGIEYTHIKSKYQGKNAYESIIYRSDKFKCDYSDFVPMSYAPSNSAIYSSGMAVAKFTSLEKPSLEVALISTHWHWEKDTNPSNPPKQYIDAVETANKVKELRQKYPNAQVFTMGDFNNHRFDGLYLDQFVNEINGAIASDIAAEKGVLTSGFKHQGIFIDHIIGKAGSFDVLRHAPSENYSNVLTDHQPIFADIKFK